MDPATTPTRPGRAGPPPNPTLGLAGSGLAIVAGVALLTSLNTTARFLVTQPFGQWLAAFGHYLAAHAFIGVAILFAAVWARRRFPERGAVQYLAAAAAVIAATAAALIALMLGLGGGDGGEPDLAELALTFFPDLFRYSLVGLVITSAWLYLCAEAEHAAATERCAIDAEDMDRQAAEARLQVLEAQIEPHFLFNTLAHVKRLYETDPAAGARMLHDLTEYLAGALPQMRAASTLGRELDHVRAYLAIQQIRMGRRLAFAIDLPDTLRSAALPPLMVLTLVENAIKHGLSPLPDGGRIDVRAGIAADGRLCVQVADTGQGFAKTGGSGTGLANTRARLASKYGAAAGLSLATNAPRGVVATITLPQEQAVAEAVGSAG